MTIETFSPFFASSVVAFARFGRVLRSANQRDDRVEVIERDLQPLEDVRARFRLA